MGIVDEDKLLILEETSDFAKGEGFRVSLYGTYLLVQTRSEEDERVIRIPIVAILSAIEQQTKLIGS